MSAVSQPLQTPVEKPELLQPQLTPKKPSSRRRYLWLVILAIVVLAGWAIYARRAANETAAQNAAAAAIRISKVTSGPIERWTRLAGQTAAIDFANVIAPSLRGPESGREMILMDLAKSGAWVTKGTPIAQIDAQSLQDHIDDLADTIETAEADIRKRKAEQAIESENLQQSLRVAKSEADKARLEFSVAEVRTDLERQILKLNLDEADAKYKQLQGDLKQKEISHAADLRLLGITLERHTRHRDRHQRDHKMFSIFAPMDGLVVMSQIFRSGEMAQVQVGDRVFPGQGFMKIVNTKKMRVEGSINQAESSEIRLGQRARVKLDAFPGMELSGFVDGIGALAVSSNRQGYYVRNVPVRVRIEGSDPRLIPDLSASVEIILEQAGSGAIVPLAALRTEGGKTVVYVKNADTFERREVQVGVKNSTHASILGGLSAGQDVRLN
jgi:HlyD family secretion protein